MGDILEAERVRLEVNQENVTKGEFSPIKAQITAN